MAAKWFAKIVQFFRRPVMPVPMRLLAQPQLTQPPATKKSFSELQLNEDIMRLQSALQTLRTSVQTLQTLVGSQTGAEQVAKRNRDDLN